MPRVLVASALVWPNVVHLSRAFRDVGFDVGAVAVAGHPVHRSQAPGHTFLYRPTAPRATLREAVAAFRPDIVIPCDDRVVGHLRALHAVGDADLAGLIEKSLGRLGASGAHASRAALAELDGLPNVKIARTARVASAAELRKWAQRHGLPAVLKLDGSWGGQHVTVIDKASDIGGAFLRMGLRRGVLRGLKRLTVNRDFEALRFGRRSTVTVQPYLRGRLANVALACWEGEVVAQIAVEVLRSKGSFGQATVVRIVDGDAMVAAARSICRHYELSGVYGLDFVIEAESGVPHLIEINWRATQTGHLPLGSGRDLAAALYAAVSGDRAPQVRPPLTSPEIALFPQEWRRHRESPYLTSAFHDVPADEPEFARFYGFDPPDRVGAPAVRPLRKQVAASPR